MAVFSEYLIPIAAALVGSLVIFQCLVCVYVFLINKRMSEQLSETSRELFGLMRKIEGLTSHKREQMLLHYDTMVQTLATRLPATIAAKAGEAIFEAERHILSRLAELEPNLHDDQLSKQRMDELIKNMERLEQTVVALTAETVQQVMLENRRVLFESEQTGERFNEILPN